MGHWCILKRSMKATITSKEVAWHVLSEPSGEELATFAREVELAPLDAEFIAQERPRPEVAAREDYLLFLIQVPVFQREERVTRGVNVYFVVTERELWTVHFEPLPALDKLRSEFERDNDLQAEYFSSTIGLAVYAMRRLFGTAFRKLEKLGRHIEIAEDAVFHGNERKMVTEIALLTRDVTDFRRIIRSQRRLFHECPEHALVASEAREMWRRLGRIVDKLWDMLENLSESVKQLGKTNFALLQHKENELLRLLTLYSILAIPILVVAQSLAAPWHADATTTDAVVFWLSFGLLVVALGIVIWRIKHKRLL